MSEIDDLNEKIEQIRKENYIFHLEREVIELRKKIYELEVAHSVANEDRLKSDHCQDCCCARSWKALGISSYTGMSIPEHIKLLRDRVEGSVVVTPDTLNWLKRMAKSTGERTEADRFFARHALNLLGVDYEAKF